MGAVAKGNDEKSVILIFNLGAPSQLDLFDMKPNAPSEIRGPFNPIETGSVKLGGIVRRQEHPARPGQPLNGAPQMVEISRDGKRVYVTNSLYRTWDDQFYPDGVKGWLAKIDVRASGGIDLDHAGFLQFDRMRPHQVHLEGGDASSDSYCFA
jgi:selenium-binding protein 1